MKFDINLSAERSNWQDEKTKLVWLVHKKTYEFASAKIKNKKNLDIGCGNGYGSFLLANYGKSTLGLDIDKPSIDYAKDHFPQKNLQFINSSLENFKTTKIFDSATCFQTIEHIKDTDVFIKKINSLLHKKGIVLFSTPNSQHNHVVSPYHVKEYSPEEFKKMLGKYYAKVKIYGIYGSIKIENLITEKNKIAERIYRLDVFKTSDLLPVSIKSIIYSLGSKIVGVFIKKQNMSFANITTDDYLITEKITNKCSDLIAICWK